MCQLSNQEECRADREGKAYTYDEAVELTGHGRYNYLLLTACSIITNAVALDMFAFSIVVAAAKCDLKLGVTEMGILASVSFAGVVFAHPWGFYADTRGRRRALVLSTGVGFLFAALSSLAPTWQLMMICKLIGCSFSTSSYPLTMTILGECTGSSRRSQYLFVMNSVNLVAECFSFGLAYFFLPLQFSIPIPLLGINFRAWRLFTFVMALPLGVGGLMIAYLHESPKFLASRGDTKKALEVLNSIHEWNGGEKGGYQVLHLVTTDNIGSKEASIWQSLIQQTVPIFKPPLLWRTLQICYLMAILLTTNNAFVMWYPTIVNIFFNSLSDERNTEKTFCARVFGGNTTVMTHGATGNTDYICDDTLSSATIISGILYGLFPFVATLLISKVASRRRLVLIFWLLISAVSGTLVELPYPAAGLVFFILFQASNIGLPSLAAYCVDLYPTAYRGMVTSLSMMFARMCALGGVNLVGAVISSYCALTFYSWALVVFSGVGVALLLPSDKKMNMKQ